MTSGVQAPPSRFMQADIGQPGGGGTFFLSFKTITSYRDPNRNLVSHRIPENGGNRKLPGFHK
ncbi:hypothetical protein GCM10007884_29070 [Methylobacterium brachythecii]|uniref:Uncharacterized protein n=1 Tax=Methylobacterium brachythecii TaxID=1176177 RepID=A0ABQ6D9E6_9HYPH|nr:hypothetical protein GCM10007884_29070 [Methylobacterium brachythecii]